MFRMLNRFCPSHSNQYREELSQRITWGHWFAFFNIIIALLIASRYAFNSDWPNTLLGKIYFFISLFGHFSFVVFAVYLLILFPLSFVIKHNKAYRSITVVLATVGMTFLLIDSEIFKQFFLHLSPFVWELLVNPDEAELSRQWQRLFVPMPLIFLAEMLFSHWSWQKLRSLNRQHWGKFAFFFFLLCFISTHLIYAVADMTRYRPITAQKANYPLSYPMTARRFLEKHHLIDRDAFDQKMTEQGRADSFFLNYPKNALQSIPPENQVNILFINFSGLSNTHITAETMPNLRTIRDRSLNFTQHYAGGSTVSESLTSLFYGLSGRYLDAILNEQKPSVLISMLQKYRYQFGLFSYEGFSHPIYQRALFSTFSLPKTQNNADAIAQWKKWLPNNADKPFFSYLALSTQNHNELDHQIKDVWQMLEQLSLLRNTFIIMTSDIASTNSLTNPFDKDRINVPMIVYWQGQQGNYQTLSSHLDILPTVLSQFLGVTSPISDYSQGMLLTHTPKRKWLLSSNYQRNVAILTSGEQFHIDYKSQMEHYDQNGKKVEGTRPPLALFLQLIKHSNQFIEK